MPTSSPVKDKGYYELKIAYELRTLMRESKVDVIETVRGVQKFTQFGRAYIRYVFNQGKDISVQILVVAFSTTADVIIAIINNNYDRKKVKNGDNVVEDDKTRKQDLNLLTSIDNWIARPQDSNQVKDEAEKKSNLFLVPLASPASTIALEPSKKKRSKKAKKQDKNGPAQSSIIEDDNNTSKKRKNRDEESPEEEDHSAGRPPKAKKIASTAGPVHLPFVSVVTTASSSSHSKGKQVKQTTSLSSSLAPTKVNIPGNIRPNVRQPLSKKESLELMDKFFKKAGSYKPDYLDQLLVDNFGPQELMYLKQLKTQEKMMEELINIDIPIFSGRPVRLSSFTEAVVNAKESAWKMLKEESEKRFTSME